MYKQEVKKCDINVKVPFEISYTGHEVPSTETIYTGTSPTRGRGSSIDEGKVGLVYGSNPVCYNYAEFPDLGKNCGQSDLWF